LFVITLVNTVLFVECGSSSIPSIHITLKGKNYELHDVSTIPQLQEQLHEQSGISPKQQGKILWNGQRLVAEQSLLEVGVQDGDQLNCIPTTTTSTSSSPKKKKSSSSTDTSSSAAAADYGSPVPKTASTTSIKDMMKGVGMDSSGVDELMKMMGKGGNNNGDTTSPDASLKESMSMMTEMMKSPLFTQLMNDPAKLEESRQMIINNPMLKQMMGSMPGMEEILNDPVAWREAMQAAANVYQNMDPDVLMNAMMEGASAGLGGGGGLGGMGGMMGSGGMGGMGLPPGLFGDTTTSSNSGGGGGSSTSLNADLAALDELSEDES
jgi:hypothetical protein